MSGRNRRWEDRNQTYSSQSLYPQQDEDSDDDDEEGGLEGEDTKKKKNVQCRQVTNVGPVAMMLGSSNALIYSQDHLYVDGWLPMFMSFESAALIGALKACLESLMLRLAHTPSLALKQDQPLMELRAILTQISDPDILVTPSEECLPI